MLVYDILFRKDKSGKRNPLLLPVRRKIRMLAPGKLVPVNNPAIVKTGEDAGAANDSLFNELETRYGGSFAQWIIDRMGNINHP